MSAWIFTPEDIDETCFGEETDDKLLLTCHMCWCVVRSYWRKEHVDVHIRETQARGHILRSELEEREAWAKNFVGAKSPALSPNPKET